MCRWFSFVLLPYIVCSISTEEQNEKSSLLNRAIHLRRHRRAEKSPLAAGHPSPFMSMTTDPNCMVSGRPMMSCPKANPNNNTEPLLCIEMSEICDDILDCHNGEDEDPHFCLFKKLEDAEMMRLKSEIRVLAQNGQRRKPEFLDVVVNNEGTPDKTRTKIPGRPGVFKIKPGAGPMAKSGYKSPKMATIDYSSEEEESRVNQKGKKQRESARRHRNRRVYRHLLGLDAVFL